MPETRTITVAGGDLFRLAADHLLDATQWFRIAELNGLSDPILSGVVTLVIPVVDRPEGGRPVL
jgi:hypothetical protein